MFRCYMRLRDDSEIASSVISLSQSGDVAFARHVAGAEYQINNASGAMRSKDRDTSDASSESYARRSLRASQRSGGMWWFERRLLASRNRNQ
jgi:hypothetical protein